MRDDDVDLLVEDAVLLGHDDRDEEDPEDVVPVALKGRARLVVMLRRREQEVERGSLNALGQPCPQLIRGRIDQVDPLGHGLEATFGVGCRT